MDDNSVEYRMATLIESIKALSTITCNHDVILSKLVDDHEQRIRLLEKCALASTKVEVMESRIRALENWRWYAVGIAVGLSTVIGIIGWKLL